MISNKCHICLEDIIHIKYRDKKGCCSSKAYICNKCWSDLLENKGTTKCPICRIPLPMIEDIESQEITHNLLVEIRNGRNQSLLTDSQLECNTLLNIFGLLFLLTLVGFIVFNICLFISVDSLEEQNEELMYLVVFPMFWILQPFIGLVVTILSLIILNNPLLKMIN
jgi:hypothetical protein